MGGLKRERRGSEGIKEKWKLKPAEIEKQKKIEIQKNTKKKKKKTQKYAASSFTFIRVTNGHRQS